MRVNMEVVPLNQLWHVVDDLTSSRVTSNVINGLPNKPEGDNPFGDRGN